MKFMKNTWNSWKKHEIHDKKHEIHDKNQEIHEKKHEIHDKKHENIMKIMKNNHVIHEATLGMRDCWWAWKIDSLFPQGS